MPFELHGSFTDRSVLAGSADGLEKVGMTGLLATRGRRAYRARVPGATTGGYRWGLLDTFTPTWWPQGIATGDHEGRPVVITSWFAQPRRGKRMGSRISVIDLRDPARPRYHHVLLVEPRHRGRSVRFEPVNVHAGGIVWSGDRLLVAATHGGIREFHLSDILRTPRTGVLRRPSGLFGYRHVLPQAAAFVPPDDTPPHDSQRKGMRYSFLSLESGLDAARASAPLPAADCSPTAPPPDPRRAVRLITGEYAKEDRGRLGRMHLTDDRSTVEDAHVPGIPEMQGAVVHNGVWFVNASRGDKIGGDLWVGTPGNMTRHAGVLPPGPEDNAVWAARDEVWSVTEFPGKRWIYAIDLRRWTDVPGTVGQADAARQGAQFHSSTAGDPAPGAVRE